jgi:hypothetical protein
MRPEPAGERAADLVPALGILTTAMIFVSLFLLYQTLAERDQLLAAKRGQDRPLQEAQQVTSQFRALASGTAGLAQGGHAGAREVIEGLQKQGIQIRSGS